LLLTAVALLPWSVPATNAHANLERAEPQPGSRLKQAPAELRLYFTQALAPRGSYVQVRDAGAMQVAVEVGFDPTNAKLMKATLPPLQPGVYTVKWQSLSVDDDDYTDGTYMLTLLQPDGSAPDGSAAEDESGSRNVAWAAAAGFAVLAAGGGLAWWLKRGARQ
jgi:methionine-rich copper-binding protein CopC